MAFVSFSRKPHLVCIVIQDSYENILSLVLIALPASKFLRVEDLCNYDYRFALLVHGYPFFAKLTEVQSALQSMCMINYVEP